MRLLFYAPHFLGRAPGGITGARVSIEGLCRRLGRRGHSVAILASLAGDRPGDVATAADDDFVVIAARAPAAALAPLLAEARPDAVVVTSAPGLADPLDACRQLRVPVVVNFVVPDMRVADTTFGDDPQFLYLAQSRFMVGRLAAWFGVTAHAVAPLVEPATAPAAAAADGERNRVLFINPVPEKGWAIFEQVAHQLRETAFIVLESWALTEGWRQHCRSRVRSFGNVDWRPMTEDMDAVWARSRLLLMPSVWEEPWGRAASEAKARGIPVVASSRGGLPEVVGPGGVVIDAHAPVAEWTGAVARLMSDRAYHAATADAARAHAARPEIHPDAVAERFLRLVGEHVERYRQGIGS